MRRRCHADAPPATPDELLAVLRAARLLSPARHHFLAAKQATWPADPRAWLDRLVGRGWLTVFQAERVLEGQGGRLNLGAYRILEPLGAGGMGMVFKAEHRWMKRVVALKVLTGRLFDEGLVLRRVDVDSRVTGRAKASANGHEITLAARVDHPHLVTAHDAGRTGDVRFLVMEYVPGLDLGRVVREAGPLTVWLACSYVRQAALGLQHLHEEGLIHGDVKPSNLLLTGVHVHPGVALADPEGRGVIKVLDLGLARPADQPGGPLDGVCGTPDYLAPEIAHDSRSGDIRSDLYSLGCTFYFLLTGQVPYPGGSWTEKLLRHSLDVWIDPEVLRPDLPPAVAAILRRLLAKEPEGRYACPAALAADLEAVQFQPPSAAPLESETCPDPSATSVPPGSGSSTGSDAEDGGDTFVGVARSSSGRRALRTAWQVGAAVVIGMGGGLLFRHLRTFEATAAPTPKAAASTAKPAHVSPTPQSRPFHLERGGATFANLGEALSAAQDGDTIVVDGGRPIATLPQELTGKALHLRAAPGARPALHLLVPVEGRPGQALLASDRTLDIEGIDLVLPVTGLPVHAVWCEGVTLRLVRCGFQAPGRCAPVVGRHCPEIHVEGCRFTADAATLCLEIGEGPGEVITLIDNEVMAGDPDGAALVLWAAESTRPSRVRLDLKGNRVEAGRVAAFTGRPVPLEVHAQGNRFTFGRGVLRFAGDADSEARRHLVAWHGRDNTYRGAGDWLCLEGRPGGVRCLADWEAWWNAEEPGSREETSSAAASPDR